MSASSLKSAESAGVHPETLRSPDAVAHLSLEQLEQLARDVRTFLLASVSRTGGHIGANLGTVELTIALHKVFRSPQDALLFDTGHQGYTHKILTGRSGMFPTLNRLGGMNRFLSRTESEHDPIEASHAGTAVSVGLGMALARKLQGDPHHVVAVVGDGSLAEGLTLEGLNHAAVEDTNLILVLNDNGYAISEGFGAIHEALQGGRAPDLFGSLGLDYIGPVDGHDLGALVAAFQQARHSERLPIVHARTIKGHGWAPADQHPYRQHFSFPFDPETGTALDPPAGPCYQDVAAAVLAEEMERDASIVCITPSTIYATGFAGIFERFPERSFDPGMEEQHALSMTTGFALAGMKPVIGYQTTFLQRAFDQLIHDVCFTNQPTLILGVRSGFAGYDNPTHHGVYDFAYLRGLPNLRVLYPKDRFETERMVRDELRDLCGPTMILMPYGPVHEIDEAVLLETRSSFGQPEVDFEGSEVLFIAVGPRYGAALEVVTDLRARGVDAGLINLRYLKPLPEDALAPYLASAQRIVTVEEAVLEGGVGGALANIVTDRNLGGEILRIGLPTAFIEPGSTDELCARYRLDAEGIRSQVYGRWPGLNRWARPA